MISFLKSSSYIRIAASILLFAAEGLIAQPAVNSLKKLFNASPQENNISQIVVYGDTVLVSTSSGLSRTWDRGESWENFFNMPSPDKESLQSVEYSNGVIWISAVTDQEFSGEMIPTGAGLKYSTDRGLSWTDIPQPKDLRIDTFLVYGNNRLPMVPIHTAVQNVTFDIAVINNAVWIASWGGGLRKTTDMGKTWQKIPLPPDSLDKISPEDTLGFLMSPFKNLNQMPFSIDAVDNLTFYVGTAGGINKTTDGGISWRKFNHLNQQKPISGNYVNRMKYNPLTKTLYGSTWRAAGSTEFFAVSFTTDGGQSWTTALEGEKPRDFGFKGEDVIAVTENGAYRSSDMGKNWIPPGKITDNLSGMSITTKVFNAAASQKDDIWLGSDFGLARLTETAPMWNGDWRVYFTSQPLASKSSSYAFPNPFYPDVERLNIKYSTGGRMASVTIRIFDFGMNLVRTLIENAERNSSGTIGSNQDTGTMDYWDGRNEKGEIVPNGVYFYRIDFDQGEPSFGKIMVVM